MNRTLDKLAYSAPFLLGSLLIAVGCGDDTNIDQMCVWVDPSDCEETGTGGGDGSDETGDDGEAARACSLGYDATPRTVHQCVGTLKVSLAFNTLLGDCAKTLGDPGWCDETHDFGHEAYEIPAVMACCDTDVALEDDVLRYCAADLVEQVCMSLPKRLQMLMDDGVIKVGKQQAVRLRNWLEGHKQDCYDTLYNPSLDNPGLLESSSWVINDGKNKDWPMLKNFTISMEQAEVYEATLPEDPADWSVCYDNRLNNTEIFEESVPISPGINDVLYLSEDAGADVWGPRLGGFPVKGSAKLSSFTDCVEPRCSSMEITESGAHWTLEDMNLYAAGPIQVSHGDLLIPIERVSVRLYGISYGTKQSGHLVIAPSDAHFLASGLFGDSVGVRWVRNATPITLRWSRRGLVVESFGLEYVDGSGHSWTATLSETVWE